MDLLWYPILVGAVLLPTVWLWRRYEPLEALLLGSGTGLCLWAAVAFARFVVVLPTSAPRLVALLALAGALLGSGVIVWLCRSKRTDSEVRTKVVQPRLLLAVAGVAVMTLGIEATVPHYGVAMLYWDWWEHFDLANFYRMPSGFFRSYGDGSTITSRTPLFNLVASLALSVIGDRFTIFQVVTAAVGWLWALPAALIARRVLADRASAILAALSLSPMILFCTAYSWPKALAFFSALFALERYLKLRDGSPHRSGAIAVQFGVASGLTVMAHAGYVGYLLPLYGLLIWDASRKRRRWTEVVFAVLMAAFVAMPWYAWGISQYGWRAGLFGYPQPGSPTIALWFVDHLTILATSLLPASLFVYGGIGIVPDLFIMYLGSAAGLLGLVFLVRSLALLLRRRRGEYSTLPLKEDGVLLAYAASGVIVTTVLINGWGNGWAAAQAVFLPALVALALITIRRRPLSSFLLRFVLAECALVVALALAYMWSPTSVHEPNAVLAAALDVRFLGRDTWPLGCALLLAGAANMFRLVLQSNRQCRPVLSTAA